MDEANKPKPYPAGLRLVAGGDFPTAGGIKLILDAADEIDRLQAIVDKLPVTADGVPVVPEMTVWPRGDCWIEDEQGAHVGVELLDIATGDRIPFGDEPYDKCYSTREAAEAAKESG